MHQSHGAPRSPPACAGAMRETGADDADCTDPRTGVQGTAVDAASHGAT